MPSSEAIQIAEKYTPDCGGNWGQELRAGKVNGLALAIDELRVRDLEVAARSVCLWCRHPEPGDKLELMRGVWTHNKFGMGPYGCVAEKIQAKLAALRAAMGDKR